MGGEHVYVYGVAEGTPAGLAAAGVPDGAPPRALAVDADVSLIVSSVPSQTYNPAALEPRLANLEWVGAAGEAHHAVIEALADAGAVILPVRLFTIFSNDRKAREAFRERRGAVARAFDRVRGRQEWVLRIGTPDPARAEASTAPAAAAAASGTGFLRAKADQRRESAARAQRVHQDAAAALAALTPLAESVATRDVDPGGTLLLDAAFLVRPARVAELKDALARAAARLLQDGCPVSLTGPWPPYSFASLDTIDD